MADDRNFGVVVFDEPHDPRAGWFAVAGSSEADRFSGINELSTDTIWWTNVPYDSFFRKTETWRVPTLRHDKYLVVNQNDVLKDWGHNPDDTDPNFTCVFCSQLFDRIMKIAWNILRDVFPKKEMSEVFRGVTLRNDLRMLIPELEYPQGESANAFQTGRAWEEITTTLVRPVRGSKRITLRRPRLSYSMEILQTPVPSHGPFELMSRADILAETNDKMDFVKKSDRPCVVNVTVKSMQPEVSHIYGFGNALEKEKKVTREWVAHPEFLELSRYADVDIRALYIGMEYWALMPEFPEPVKEFLSNKYAESSWSAGIVAETIWRSVMLPADKSKSFNRFEDEVARTSWQGLWIRSADKALMFMLAIRLTELGYSINSYGLGWVSCSVPEENINELIRDGLTLGLIPRLSDVPENVFNFDIPWNGDAKARMLAQLTVTNNVNMLWNLDKILLLPADKRSAFVRKLMERFINK